jgi:hypothetical protein
VSVQEVDDVLEAAVKVRVIGRDVEVEQSEGVGRVRDLDLGDVNFEKFSACLVQLE